MGISAKIILNTCAEAVFLRLCVRPCYTVGTTRIRTVDVIKRFSENYKHISVCHNYSSSAITEYQHGQPLERDVRIFEHEAMHKILKNSKHYDRTVMSPIKATAIISSIEISQLYDINWTSASGQDIFKAIKRITYNHLNGSPFDVALCDDLLCSITSKLPELNDVQTHFLLQCLITVKAAMDQLHFNKNFLKALNKECLRRFFSKDRETLLLFCDAFYQLRDQDSTFLWRTIRKLVTKPQKLSTKYLVQTLFLLNSVQLGSAVNMFEIELRIEECIHEMSINELGIVARSLFLCKHRIKNKKLLTNIMKKTDRYAHMIDNIPLGSIMKLIRYSDSIHCLPVFQNLLVSLRNEVSRLSLKSFTHITHAFGSLHVYDELLTKRIAERVTKEVANERLKDIERIIYGITSVTPFTQYYNDVCQTLVNEVLLTYQTSRSIEIQNFPSSLTRILTFISIKNIYVPELLYFAFDPKFVRTVYKNNINLLTNELLTLHCSVKIDLPDYEGPLLEDHLYQYLIKKYSITDNMQTMDRALSLKTELVFIAKNKLGIDVCVDCILPHYAHKDIVFGTDKDNNPIKVEPILSAMPTGSIKCVKSDELEKINWHVFLILSEVTKVLGHDGYVGNINRKIRHFRTTGYKPILIDTEEWNACHHEQEKVNYLKQQIYKCENLSL